MQDIRVVVLQGSNVEKLQQDLADILRVNDKQPASITQSKSAVPVVGSAPIGKVLSLSLSFIRNDF
jgi:hypothetical protein